MPVHKYKETSPKHTVHAYEMCLPWGLLGRRVQLQLPKLMSTSSQGEGLNGVIGALMVFTIMSALEHLSKARLSPNASISLAVMWSSPHCIQVLDGTHLKSFLQPSHD